MPTTVTKSIRTDGAGDYTTLQTWDDAAPANLVTADQIWRGECTVATDEFVTVGATLTVSGSTTDATRYKELTTGAGASFRDHASVQTNALKYNASNGVGIRSSEQYASTISVSEANFHMSKLQVQHNVVTQANRALFSGANTTVLDGCIFENLANSGAIRLDGTGTVSDCLMIKRISGTGPLLTTINGAAFINCTFVQPDDLATMPTNLLDCRYSTHNFKNCAIFAGDSTKAIGGNTSFTTCYTDVTGTTGLTQVTYANQFQNINDATRDFRLKSGADCINNGTTDSTNAPIDIAGTARPSGSAYDVGCWEFVAAAGGGTILPFMMNYCG